MAGIYDVSRPCLNLSPEEAEILTPPSEPVSLDSPPSVAAWGTKTERDELLDHLHLSLLTWDESVLATLSPKLTAGSCSSGDGQGRGCCSP